MQLRPPAAAEQCTNADLVEYRSIVESDVPFVRNSWLRSYNEQVTNQTIPVECRSCGAQWTRREHAPRGLSQTVYREEHKPLVGDILMRSETIIAHAPNDTNHLVGYVCFEAQEIPVLHYVYVKESFRRLGIGSRLLDHFLARAAGFRCWASHWSWSFEHWLLGDHDITFNPYRAFCHGHTRA